jgi:hypothetical protein
MFEALFEFAQGEQNPALVLVDPTFRDLLQGNGVEIVKLFPAAPNVDDKVRLVQQPEMLGHGLPRHIKMLAEIAQGLPVVLVEFIEQSAPAGISERLEDFIHRNQYATKWLHV